MKIKYLYYILILFLTACAGLYHPEKQTIKLADIHQYAEMAAYSYYSNTSIQHKFNEQYSVSIFEIPDLKVKYYILKDHVLKSQYIVVRGTDNIENAITNFQYLKTKDPKTQLFFHDGFLEAANHIYQQLMENEDGRMSPAYNTILVGHSLGGAIVSILGTYFQKTEVNLRWIVTFGQPKYTNEDGVARSRNLPLIRIVNEGDLVPMMPPTSLLTLLDGEYHHTGLEIYLTDDGKMKYTTVGGKAVSDNTSFWESVINAKISIEKHLMGAYIQKIDRLINKVIYVEYQTD